MTVIRSGAGLVGGVALATAFLPSITQTVLFEPTWWFAAGLFLGGKVGFGREPPLELTGLGAGTIGSANQ